MQNKDQKFSSVTTPGREKPKDKNITKYFHHRHNVIFPFIIGQTLSASTPDKIVTKIVRFSNTNNICPIVIWKEKDFKEFTYAVKRRSPTQCKVPCPRYLKNLGLLFTNLT